MPFYTLESPNGRTLEIEADSPPSEQDVIEIFQKAGEYSGEEETQISSEENITPAAAFLIGVKANIGSAAGSAVGGGLGAAGGALAGATVGSVVPVVGTGIGGIVGGIVGGLGGGMLGSSVGKVAQDVFMGPDEAQKMLEEAQAARAQHGLAFELGGISANIVAVRPSIKNIKGAVSLAKEMLKNPSQANALIKDIRNVEKVNNLLNVGLGVGMQGGQEIVQAINDPESVDAVNIAARMVGAGLMTETWGIGKFLAFDGKRLLGPGETWDLKYGNTADKLAADWVDNSIPLRNMFDEAANRIDPNDPNASRQLKDLTARHSQAKQQAAFKIKGVLESLESMKKNTRIAAEEVAKGEAGLGVPKTARTNFDDLSKQVFNYADALDSLDYNKTHGDGAAGMTNKEAQAIITETESLAHATRVKEMAAELSNFSKAGENLLEDFATPEQWEKMKAARPNYISRQRLGFEDIPDTLEPFFIPGKGSSRARMDFFETGLQRNAAANILFHRNEYRKLLGSQVQAHPGAFEGLASHWQLVETPTGNPIYKNSRTGQTKTSIDLEKLGVIPYMVKGKKNYIEVVDPLARQTLRGIDKTQLDGALKGLSELSKWTRYISVSLPPDFALSNYPRDLVESMINVSAQTNSLRKGAQTLLAQPAAAKAIFDYSRGADTPGARAVKKMLEAGAYQGGFAGVNIEARKKVVALSNLAQKNSLFRGLRAIENGLRDWNETIELMPRVAAWLVVKDNPGMTLTQKIDTVNNSTVNWAVRGNKSNVLNAIWAFSSANISGTARNLRSLSNPKVAAAVASSALAVNSALHFLNKQQDPDYEKKMRPWDRDNNFNIVLPAEEGRFRYLSIPIAWGFKPTSFLAKTLVKSLAGEGPTEKEFADQFGTILLTSYSPLGGANIAQALSPTATDPFVSVLQNKSWAGNPIRPTVGSGGAFPAGTPASKAYNADKLEGTWYGRGSIGLADQLSKMGKEVNPHDIQYVLEQFTGSAGRFAGKITSTSSKILQGRLSEVEINEIPMVSKLLREVEDAEVVEYPARTKEELEEAFTEERITQAADIRKVNQLYAQYRRATEEGKQTLLEQISATDPRVASKVKEKITRLAVKNDRDREMIRSLPVESGARARVIYRTLDTFESLDEAQEFYEALKSEKILTKKVEAQLQKLLEAN